MHIPAYQIHNVLKVYTKQLSHGKSLAQRTDGLKPSQDKIDISNEGKRQAIIEKVAADIIERITNFGPQDESDQDIITKLEEELGESVEFTPKDETKKDETEFVFNVIDENNEKTTNKLSIKDHSFVINRLEQLVKEAVNKNMEL